jgi:hypothetical protein
VWSGIVTGDTLDPLKVVQSRGFVASVQISGTFGGATVTLQHSNDGTTWVTAKDVRGNDVTATAAAIFEVSLSSAYIRPAIASGSANAVNVIAVMRG